MEVTFYRDSAGNTVIRFSESVKLKDHAPVGIMSMGTTSDGKPIENLLDKVDTLILFKDLLK